MEPVPNPFALPNALEIRVYLSSGAIGHFEGHCRSVLPRFGNEWNHVMYEVSQAVESQMEKAWTASPKDLAILIELFPVYMSDVSTLRDLTKEMRDRQKSRRPLFTWDATPESELTSGNEEV